MSALDYSLLIIVLGLTLYMAFFFGKRHKNTNDYFLAGRRIPWLVACLSLMATEISILTVMAVAASSFREDWSALQYFIGSAAARVCVAYFFIPVFYQTPGTTIYEYLRRRFGEKTRYAAAGFFFLFRFPASAVRLTAAAAAIGQLMGWPMNSMLLILVLLALLYVGYGGVEAAAWAGVMQTLVVAAAAAATLAFICGRVDGGLEGIWDISLETGKLQFFNSSALPAVISGFFVALAAIGADHEMMQKLFIVKDRRESQKAVLFSIPGSFLILILFLSIGTGLFAFYRVNTGMSLPARFENIYPHFTATVMPALLRGLILTAFVLSVIDLPLTSMGAVFLTDLYRPLRPDRDTDRGSSEITELNLARALSVIFALILGALAYFFIARGRFLWLAFQIGGVAFGPLLGIFLLGLFTRVKADKANAVAMSAIGGLNAILLYLSQIGLLPFSWNWLVVIGTAGTFVTARWLAPQFEGELSKAGKAS
ncbi:MAG: hypothetical protein A3J74_10295 [Elusimicrobia bacterium RIFCSPHIGHO2_02_FULL_57_9]|nr:MAG: hypothetical protein A3J74_10295 [Elusimicrobia bacterium RIFCSPHIGHO2_02_FULL_57_9]